MMHRDNLAFPISTEYFVRLSTFADGELSFMFQWLLCIPTCTQLKFYILHTQSIYVFFSDLRTNSKYFPTQQQVVGIYNTYRVIIES